MTTLRDLAWIVTRDVNRTVGGGNASMELLRRSFEARRWVDAPTHALMMAVSRLTPGTNILAYCAAVGWRLHGWRGTLAALAGASIPGALIVFLMSAALGRLDRYAAVRVALAIGMLVAGVLVLSGAWHLLKPYLRSARWRRALIIMAIAGALSAAGWTPVRILLVSALAGALMPVSRSAARRDGHPQQPPVPASGGGGSSDPPASPSP